MTKISPSSTKKLGSSKNIRFQSRLIRGEKIKYFPYFFCLPKKLIFRAQNVPILDQKARNEEKKL